MTDNIKLSEKSPQVFTIATGEQFTLSYDSCGYPIITMDTIQQFQIVFKNVHTKIHTGPENFSEIYAFPLQAEDKSANPIQALCLEHKNYNLVEHLLLNCDWGIYTPKEFVSRYFDQLINKEEFNKEIFDNPENDWYWPDWEHLLNNARIELEGRTCYLAYNEHTNDLCAYPIIETNDRDKIHADENI